jgi:acyl carrier protein
MIGEGNIMTAEGILETVVREMGIPIPGNGALSDAHRISEDLCIDSLQFILFILKTEQIVGRKVFTAETLGGLKTISDIKKLIDTNQDRSPALAHGIGKEAT